MGNWIVAKNYFREIRVECFLRRTSTLTIKIISKNNAVSDKTMFFKRIKYKQICEVWDNNMSFISSSEGPDFICGSFSLNISSLDPGIQQPSLEFFLPCTAPMILSQLSSPSECLFSRWQVKFAFHPLFHKAPYDSVLGFGAGSQM